MPAIVYNIALKQKCFAKAKELILVSENLPENRKPEMPCAAGRSHIFDSVLLPAASVLPVR